MLEKAIKDLTVAVKELTEATIAKGGCSTPKEVPLNPVSEGTKEVAPEEKAEVKESKPATQAVATFDEMKAIILDVAKSVDNGREAIVKALKAVGAEKAPEVKEGDYGKVIDALQKVLDKEVK